MLTLALAVAVTPPALAVIWADPVAMSVTTPESDTFAICGLLDAHFTETEVSRCPLAFMTDAATVTVWPGLPETAAGVNATDATGEECSEALPGAVAGASTAVP